MELYPPQEAHSANLLRALNKRQVSIDRSKTGVGKTVMNSWLAAQAKRPVGVICPKVVRPVWKTTLAEFGVTPLFVINYEMLRTGNTPHGGWQLKTFDWKIPKDTHLIWDEAHRCQGNNSQNARMMASAKPFHNSLLSATLAQDPTEMRALGFLTGLHNWGNFYRWCLRTGCWRGAFGGLQFKKTTAEKYLTQLHHYLYPEFGGGLSHSDLLGYFPENHIVAEALDFGKNDVIQREYEAFEADQADAIAAGELNSAVAYGKTRQAVELLKVPGLISMAEDAILEGNSVIIFTNFRASLDALCEKLKCGGIYGGQKDEGRERAIDDFQADRSRCIVVNVQAGGVGLSLHDINGLFPRVTLICPPDDAKALVQLLGRAHRVGGKSPVLQRIVFAAGTDEEQVCERVQEKINNIDLLNEADLNPSNSFTEKNRKKLLERGCKHLGHDVSSAPLNTLDGAAIVGPLMQTHEVPPLSTPVSEPPPSDATQPVAVVLAHSDRKHAPLSPSTLKSKAICPGYINDPKGDKSAADRGTRGHEAVEKNDPSLVAHDPNLKTAVERCIAYKRRIAGKLMGYVPPRWPYPILGPQMYQEVRLDYIDGQWGFVDCVLSSYDIGHILDWKFAKNFYPADSPQFWAYTIGAFDKWEHLSTITVHAVHPFLNEADVVSFSREKDYDRLVAQIKAIIVHAKRNDPADYQVSQQCQYCGLAGKCTKLASLGYEIAQRYAPDLDLPQGTLHGSQVTDPATFTALLRLKPIVEKAAEGWSRAALELWDAGQAIPGYEPVQRAGKRSIASAKAAYDVIKREAKGELKPEDFIQFCDLKATSVDEIIKLLSKRGAKKDEVARINAVLTDEEILTKGGGARFLGQSK